VSDVSDGEHIHAEFLDVSERLILAPESGTFSSHDQLFAAPRPVRVSAGDEIGVVLQLGEKHAVLSRFSGLLRGLLVLPGERVRSMQPVAWMTTDDREPEPSPTVA
jgi:hypothetical protein